MVDKLSRFTTSIKRNENAATNKLAVIILGSRVEYGMKSVGPKSIIKMTNGKRVIDKFIEDINVYHPKSEIILTCGFDSEKVIRHAKGVRIIENQLYESTNEAEDLRLAINSTLCNRALIFSSNTIFTREVIKKVCNYKSNTIVEKNDFLDKEDVGATILDNHISILSYGLIDSPKWCGITYLEGKEFSILKKIINNTENKRLFMFEILNKILEKNGTISSEEIDGKIIKLYQTADLEKINKEYY